MRNKEIAYQIGTTEQVIKNYLRKVYDKLGVSDRLELALYCLHHQLLKKYNQDPRGRNDAERNRLCKHTEWGEREGVSETIRALKAGSAKYRVACPSFADCLSTAITGPRMLG